MCDLEDEIRWSSDDIVLSATTSELGPYNVPKLEANTYYADVSPKGDGPKVIYRTPDDLFEEPTGPWTHKHLMRLVAVPDSRDFGSNVAWDAIRDQVCGLPVTQQFLYSRLILRLLDEKKIKFISVNFTGSTHPLLGRSGAQDTLSKMCDSGSDIVSHTG